MTLECRLRSQQFGYAFDEGKPFPFEEFIRAIQSIVFMELRFVIEQFELGRSPGHMQKK